MGIKSKSFASAVYGLVSALALSVAVNAHAAPICRNLFEEPFWARNAVVLKPGSNLTYSFDSELLMGDAWAWIMKNANPGQMKRATQLLNSMSQPMTVQELGELTRSSAAQVRMFVIRKGVPEKATYRMSDLNPSAISILHTILKDRVSDDTKSIMSGIIVPVAEEHGFPLDAEIDGGFVEVKHASSETSPANYRRVMARLHREFKKPQTHFHVGLPADSVSEAAVAEIAHALETKITLGHLEAAIPDRDEELEYSTTSFYPNPRSVNGYRGNVKMQFDVFTKPVLAHDLEIRQWRNLEDGMRSVEIASHMAEKAANHTLKLRPVMNYSKTDDRYGAVKAVLSYAARVLAATDRPLARQLQSFAQKVQQDQGETHADVSDALINEISQFIRRNRVVSKYEDALMGQ